MTLVTSVYPPIWYISILLEIDFPELFKVLSSEYLSSRFSQHVVINAFNSSDVAPSRIGSLRLRPVSPNRHVYNRPSVDNLALVQ